MADLPPVKRLASVKASHRQPAVSRKAGGTAVMHRASRGLGKHVGHNTDFMAGAAADMECTVRRTSTLLHI